MIVKARCNSDGSQWGVVESYREYYYADTVTIKCLGVGVGPSLVYGRAFLLLAGRFLPILGDDVETRNIGIGRYLAAKKPIYSLLSDDGQIVRTDVRFAGDKVVRVKSSILVITGITKADEFTREFDFREQGISNDYNSSNIEMISMAFKNRARFLEQREARHTNGIIL